jgi:hypothetical protein
VAKGLLSHLTAPFVQQYVEMAVLRGQNTSKDVEVLLHQCYNLGRHTHIAWFRPHIEPIRFAWVERVVRPWGQSLPYQCPACKSIFAWHKGKTEPTGAINFHCNGQDSLGANCNNTVLVSNELKLEATEKGHMGKWMKGPL